MASIGIKGVEEPKQKCTDRHCPFHGDVTVRGRTFEGIVTKAKMAKTVVVKWEKLRYIRKYERYLKMSTTVHAHNSPCIGAKEGDTVLIMETRPISKTKSFAVIKIIR